MNCTPNTGQQEEGYFSWDLRKTIRPRTPEHNGKVERSHRLDQERFYRTLSFHSLPDLREQGARRMRRYNSTPRMMVGLMSPNQAELPNCGSWRILRARSSAASSSNVSHHLTANIY